MKASGRINREVISDPKIDYFLVLIKLIEELDKHKYNSNSLPLKRVASSVYSMDTPSLQVQNSEDAPLVIYDIEVFNEVNPALIKKWKRHSELCRFIYILVLESIESKVEEMCAKELKNYLIIPFLFERKGNNREAIIKFP